MIPYTRIHDNVIAVTCFNKGYMSARLRADLRASSRGLDGGLDLLVEPAVRRRCSKSSARLLRVRVMNVLLSHSPRAHLLLENQGSPALRARPAFLRGSVTATY